MSDRDSGTERAVPQPGLLLVDKPAGISSHGVISRLRRALGTRKVGHAGTLDPMATGLLLVGVERGTRLLGHLQLATKAYDATIRLGAATFTDDAEGEVVAVADAAAVAAVTDDAIARAVAALTGDIEQVPTAVSAIKVDGKRSYARARAGESVEHAARPVRIETFEVRAIRRVSADLGTYPGPESRPLHGSRPTPVPTEVGLPDVSETAPDGAVHSLSGAEVEVVDVIDIDVHVVCSSGTYIRALARDLGDALGVGGHLTVLRRTDVGPFSVADATPLDAIEAHADPSSLLVPLGVVARQVFPCVDLDAEQAHWVRNGRRLPLDVIADAVMSSHAASSAGSNVVSNAATGNTAPVVALLEDGRLLALAEPSRSSVHYVAVFAHSTEPAAS